MRLITPQWPTPESIHGFVTTRSGGVSSAPFNSLNLGDHVGDDSCAVISNRALVKNLLPNEPIWLSQTHSTLVSTPNTRKQGAQNEPIHADASVTNIPNEVLAILTADCLPVLFSSKDGRVVGAAHAGWRGLCAGVLENTVTKMLELESGLRANDLLAWMGPAIGPDAFEVGEDVLEAFKVADGPSIDLCFMPIESRPRKFMANIYELARSRLRKIGLDSVFGGGRCTVKEADDFFSYRRDGKTGRLASVIWISK